MARFSLLILICIIIWVFWMSIEWLRNRDKTPLVPNPEKKRSTNKLKQQKII